MRNAMDLKWVVLIVTLLSATVWWSSSQPKPPPETDGKRQWVYTAIDLEAPVTGGPSSPARTVTASEFLRTVCDGDPKYGKEIERSVFLSKVGQPDRKVWKRGQFEEWTYACKDTNVLLYVRSYRQNGKEYFHLREWWVD